MEPNNSRLKTIWADREKRIIIGLCLFLIVSIAVVYGQTAGFDFVTYDDQIHVVNNPKVPGGLTWDGIKWAFTTSHAGYWCPLTWVSFMLDRDIFGLDARGFHLTNVALHIANTLLLFWVLRRYTRALWPSFFVAACFALHPLHVESVAWVTERKDVLSTLFWLLTMLAYLRYVELRTAWRYATVLVCYLLGLMSKPMLVTLPFVLLIMDYWPLRCLWPDEGVGGVSAGRLLVEKIPLFILSVLSSVVTVVAQRTSMVTLVVLPLGYRISNTLVAYVGYILKMLRPVDLAVIYPHPRDKLTVWSIAASSAVLLAITVVAILLRRRRYLLAGWLWYLGTLVPVIGLVQVGRQAMADRYTYVPLAGLFIMLVWLASDIISKWRHRAVIVGVGGTALIAVLGILTFRQVGYWRDTVTLFTHTTAVTTNNVLAHNELGMFYLGKGDVAGAMREFEQALKIEPMNIIAIHYAGDSLARQGRTDEAIEFYNLVLAKLPGDAYAYGALAAIETGRSNFGGALNLYRKGLEIDPNNTAFQEAINKVKEMKAGAASVRPVNP